MTALHERESVEAADLADDCHLLIRRARQAAATFRDALRAIMDEAPHGCPGFFAGWENDEVLDMAETCARALSVADVQDIADAVRDRMCA